MKQDYFNISLRNRNSFGVDVEASRLIEFESVEDLVEIFESGAPKRWMALGGGNNILFTSNFSGVLISSIAKGISIKAESATTVSLHVEAGVEWDDLVRWCVERDYWGIENLSLIPGKCGAAPVQNIGAYGVELCDVIDSVEMFSPESLNTLILSKEHCQFGYRESIFKGQLKGRVIITAINITLSKIATPRVGYRDVIEELAKKGEPTLQNIRDVICQIRESKLPDPKVLGNGGSFFKNPIVALAKAEELREIYPQMPSYPVEGESERVKLAAGWLIDTAGYKGYRDGAVGVHQNQALVLVNYGGGSGADVLALAGKIQAAVIERFGVEIEMEINVIGE